MTVLSLGGTAFLGFDPDDPDVAEIDFPKLEIWQVSGICLVNCLT